LKLFPFATGVNETAVVHLGLGISPQIFEKNLQGFNGIFRGLGENLFLKYL
jgi:hypothetical protein